MKNGNRKTPWHFLKDLVVTYAIIIVFKLANSEDENAKKIRKFLVNLSKKLMEYGVEYPYILTNSSNWTLDILENFSVDELYKLKE